MRTRCLLLAALLLTAGCADRPAADATYVAEVDAWAAQRTERLRSETGWLTLVGLHPLQAGVQEVGSAPGASVRLTAKAPARVGAIDVTKYGVLFTADPAVDVFVKDAAPQDRVAAIAMATDAQGAPTILTTGSLEFHVIDRQGDLYLRVKDRESEVLKTFRGIERYPVDAKWRVMARLEGGEGTLQVPNVLGQLTAEPTPGALVFELDGQEYRLTPTGDASEGMFLVFGDATNGHGTYPGGRFLVIEPVSALGATYLDFNKAYNPPCVFTPYATCPLPAPGNTLPVPVTAGEKVWGEH